jgi:hypothetical protein
VWVGTAWGRRHYRNTSTPCLLPLCYWLALKDMWVHVLNCRDWRFLRNFKWCSSIDIAWSVTCETRSPWGGMGWWWWFCCVFLETGRRNRKAVAIRQLWDDVSLN